MRTLIVEDDSLSREILVNVLGNYGECDQAANGQEAVNAFEQVWEQSRPYDLICMDIMMPQVDGLDALRRIRQIEKSRKVSHTDEAKVIMATALSDSKHVIQALYEGGASAYFVKPIEVDALVMELRKLGLIDD